LPPPEPVTIAAPESATPAPAPAQTLPPTIVTMAPTEPVTPVSARPQTLPPAADPLPQTLPPAADPLAEFAINEQGVSKGAGVLEYAFGGIFVVIIGAFAYRRYRSRGGVRQAVVNPGSSEDERFLPNA